MKFPDQNNVVFENIFQLRAAGCHHDIGRAFWRQVATVKVRVVEKIDAVDDYALLASSLSAQHLFSLDDAGVFLNHLVAGAAGKVITIGPHCRPRIVGKKRPQKFVSIVRTERVAAGAHGITH